MTTQNQLIITGLFFIGFILCVIMARRTAYRRGVKHGIDEEWCRQYYERLDKAKAGRDPKTGKFRRTVEKS
jgi:hypothetical protein